MKTTVEVTAGVKSKHTDGITIEVSIPLVNSMVAGEEVIQAAVNAVGMLGTNALLEKFDTDGSAIRLGDIHLTSKGQVEKDYETPYGTIRVERYVYQSSKGGATYCPLEDRARIIGTATPKLAKMIASKYSRSSTDEVKDDFWENHGRDLSRGYIQQIADEVGDIALQKEGHWCYAPAIDADKEVSTIAIGMDGAMVLMREDGYRQAMSGSIAFYDQEGERLHTDYIATAPEYGKAKFLARMEREITELKKRFPNACYVGIADGASDNWKFLEKHTSIQITDFYHATEYLTTASHAIYTNQQEKARIAWLEKSCHHLKHQVDAVTSQLNELKRIREQKKLSASNQEKLDSAITYLTNQGKRMDYSTYRSKQLPIGSGVTEAACKTVIKQRLCRSGMRWKDRGASIVLALKCLLQSKRWEQFWDKINQFGMPVTA